jgi:hypothetical protein
MLTLSCCAVMNFIISQLPAKLVIAAWLVDSVAVDHLMQYGSGFHKVNRLGVLDCLPEEAGCQTVD